MRTALTVVPQIQVTLDCNSACTYCFQHHSGQVIDLSTVACILEKTVAINLRRPLPFSPPSSNALTVTWHGGEPLLAGLDFFRKVVEIQGRYPHVSFDNRLQTNGTLMDEELARFFSDNDFSVGFSLDGPEDLHNENRLFKRSAQGTFAATMRGIEIYMRIATPHRIPVIAVVTKSSVGREGDIFRFFEELRANVQLDFFDVRGIDLVSPGSDDPFRLAPSSQEVGDFLIRLFDLWFYDQNRMVEFTDLRDEVKMVLQPRVNLGDPLHKKRCDHWRTIFHPSGRVYSCDQYINDERTALGDIRTDSLESILKKKAKLWEAIKRHVRGSGKEMACSVCEWGNRHMGGCLSCMKFSARLLAARTAGRPDEEWYKAKSGAFLDAVAGETYYCDGLRRFRGHVKDAIEREKGYA